MKWRMIYHLMRADFLERVRSYSFLGMLLFTVFATYLFIPAPEAMQIAGLQLGGYRSTYNSAWIGSMTTLLMGEFFLLFAFYLLKGSTERDRRTGVGQIIATTLVTKSGYTLGKWLSNIAVVTAMVAMIIAASIVLQLIRGEDYSVNLGALTSPFILVLLPALIVIAAAAVLFDNINWLRGTLGNILFFFLAYPILTLALDLPGNEIIYPSIYQACAAQFANCNPLRQIDAGMPPLMGLPIFQYNGIPWTFPVIAGRFGVIVVGAMIALLASRFFHRFDPAKTETSLPKLFARQDAPKHAAPAESFAAESTPIAVNSTVTLTPIPSGARSSLLPIYCQLLKTEIKLIFKDIRWPWYLVALGIIAASWLSPLDAARLVILPMAWIWPLPLWSALGTREVRHRSEQIIFSAPFSLWRQLPVTWLVGVLISLAMGNGLIIRYLLAAQWTNLLALLIGAAFVPSLALAIGIWSGGSKLFEGSYLFAWYLASVMGVLPLDFMGRLSTSFNSGVPWVYSGLTLLLIGIAVIGRRHQIKR
jgi:hypothetical protein